MSARWRPHFRALGPGNLPADFWHPSNGRRIGRCTAELAGVAFFSTTHQDSMPWHRFDFTGGSLARRELGSSGGRWMVDTPCGTLESVVEPGNYGQAPSPIGWKPGREKPKGPRSRQLLSTLPAGGPRPMRPRGSQGCGLRTVKKKTPAPEALGQAT